MSYVDHCRIDNDKPRLGDFRRQLIGQLKETLQRVSRRLRNDFHRALTGRRSARFSAMLSILLTESFLPAE